MDWDYFDPNFGFSYQVIYSGKEDPGFILEGKILDIGTFRKSEDRYVKGKGDQPYTIADLVLALLGITCFGLFGIISTNPNEKRTKPVKVLLRTAQAAIAIATLSGIWYNIYTYLINIDPPF